VELPRTAWKRNPEKYSEEKDKRGRWNNGKDLDGPKSERWKEIWLALLCGGPVFRSGATGIYSIIAFQAEITHIHAKLRYYFVTGNRNIFFDYAEWNLK
jgi:hypothetical protein